VTLGLPIVRTSAEHGTGFAIAGKGVADPSSMVDAVALAARLVGGRRKGENVGAYDGTPQSENVGTRKNRATMPEMLCGSRIRCRGVRWYLP